MVRIVKDGYVDLGVIDLGDGKVALVDAGNDPEGKAILAELSRRKLGPEAVEAVLLTHGHPDHIAGCHLFPKASIYALAGDVALAEGREGSKGPVDPSLRRQAHGREDHARPRRRRDPHPRLPQGPRVRRSPATPPGARPTW